MGKRLTGTIYSIVGLTLCVLGFKTLWPAILMTSHDLENTEFSISLSWPGLIMLIFLTAYVAMIGKNFFMNS